MSESKMKVAHIGVGGFGGYRRDRMRETGLFELVAAYDLNPAALKACQEQDGATPVGSYEELLDTPDIEAMIISTGGKFHAEQVVAAAKRGLHVFVEKPLCSTMDEVHQILQAQTDYGVVIGVGHADHSSHALSNTIKRMIDEGQLGTITAFHAVTAHSGGRLMKPTDWRADPDKNPGGMLFQCGVHKLHELMYFFGPIKRVSAMMRYDVHTSKTADAAICNLEFESGLIGSLHAYHVTPYTHSLNIFGTNANLYRDDLFFDEGSKVSIQVEEEGKPGAKMPRTPVSFAGNDDPCGNLRSFYKAVREGGTPYPSVEDGARAVAVVFAAEEAAGSGGTVAIPNI